jgi:Icc-related predicted phosphoesterase
MKSFFGGKKAAEHPVEKSIKVNRSDDAAQDLNAILASADIAGILNNSYSATTEKPKQTDEHEEDHGKIALTRSDGVNHCIINVFKGVSDAKGETMMRTSMSEQSNSKITVSHALSSSAIRNIGLGIPSSVRIVHMSDTSNFLTASNPTTFVPKGDIFVHSGNFTVYGAKKEFEQFNVWLGTIANDFKYRIVTLGCRDVKEFGNNWDTMRSLLANATHVLCHESAVVLGIRFYACPWHWGHHKNYLVRKGAPASTSGRFDEIPEDTQVLITHGAASGVLDTSNLPGSKELTEGIRRAKPALHLHGHSKGAHGVVPAFAKYPLVVNSALCDADSRVMYACAHVVRATQIGSSDSSAMAGAASWNFAMDSLM